MSRVKELSGMSFSKLTVVSRSTNSNAGKARWNCKCECGNITVVVSSHLISGHTKSCGCEQIEKTKTHYMCKSRPYYIWADMKNRCSNSNYRFYFRYGGRGIRFCKEWESFETFWEDMKDGYSDNLTIDRIDVNGNYEKNNCKWATKKEQGRNRRNNTLITYNGITKCVSEWSESTGIKEVTIHSRIKRNYSIESIFINKPFERCKNKVIQEDKVVV